MDSSISTHSEENSALAPAARAAGPGQDNTPAIGAESRERQTQSAVTILAPAPAEGGEGSSMLVGLSVALQCAYENYGAFDGPKVVEILSSDKLAEIVSALVDDADTFGGDVRTIHPYWLAAGALVLELRAIRAARPRPATIGGFPLTQAIEGAITLSTISPPFDIWVNALKDFAEEVAVDGHPNAD